MTKVSHIIGCSYRLLVCRQRLWILRLRGGVFILNGISKCRVGALETLLIDGPLTTMTRMVSVDYFVDMLNSRCLFDLFLDT